MRRCFQFRLRSLFLVVTLATLFCWLAVPPLIKQYREFQSHVVRKSARAAQQPVVQQPSAGKPKIFQDVKRSKQAELIDELAKRQRSHEIIGELDRMVEREKIGVRPSSSPLESP